MSPLRRNIRQFRGGYEKPVGPAKLYLDDIGDLIDVMRGVAQQEMRTQRKYFNPGDTELADEEQETPTPTTLDSLNIHLNVEGARADDIDDLRDASHKDLENVTIYCSQPHLHIMLSRTGSSSVSTIRGEDPDMRALVEDLADFIQLRRRWDVYFWSHLALFGLGVLVLTRLLLFPSQALFGAPAETPRLLATVAIVMGALLIFGDLRLNGRRRVIVIPERRSEARGLSRQTRRELSIALFSTLVGAVLAVIGSLIVNEISK